MAWYLSARFWNWAAFLLLVSVIVSRLAPGGSHAIAQPVPVPAATTNTYWAGYVVANGAQYSGVRASWTVPPANCRQQQAPVSTAYAWIGEGGYLRGLASSLIQAGTASDCVRGQAQYTAFYEWYPGIFASNFPIAVRAGDRLTVSLAEVQPDYWMLSVENETSGQRSATATEYAADTDSVDFIVERPTVCGTWSCDQVPLAPFGSVTFQNIHIASGVSGAASPAVDRNANDRIPIALVADGTDRTLAVPGQAQPNGLSVLWRSPQ